MVDSVQTKLLGHAKHMEKQALCLKLWLEVGLQTTNPGEWEDGVKADIPESIAYFLDHLTLLLYCITASCSVWSDSCRNLSGTS